MLTLYKNTGMRNLPTNTFRNLSSLKKLTISKFRQLRPFDLRIIEGLKNLTYIKIEDTILSKSKLINLIYLCHSLLTKKKSKSLAYTKILRKLVGCHRSDLKLHFTRKKIFGSSGSHDCKKTISIFFCNV